MIIQVMYRYNLKVLHLTLSTHAGGEVKEVEVELFPWEKLDKVEEVKAAFGL